MAGNNADSGQLGVSVDITQVFIIPEEGLAAQVSSSVCIPASPPEEFKAAIRQYLDNSSLTDTQTGEQLPRIGTHVEKGGPCYLPPKKGKEGPPMS